MVFVRPGPVARSMFGPELEEQLGPGMGGAVELIDVKILERAVQQFQPEPKFQRQQLQL